MTPVTTPKAETPEIRLAPMNDGREEDCQCARCGSSCYYMDCDECVDGYSHHDCGEDCCSCVNAEYNVRCAACGGSCGWQVCMSGQDWCEANPIPGREQIEHGAIEWFDIPARPEPS